MANIGLGLRAADAYFKADDDRKEREYVQAKRDAELSMLGDRTEAERTGYRLRRGENTASLETLPGRTANTVKRQTLEGGALDGQIERQPTDLATQRIQGEVGLSNVQNQQTMLPQTQEVANNAVKGQVLQSRGDLAQLPEKIRMAAVQGRLTAQGQAEVVVGTLGQLIARQDKEAALDFANRIAQVSDILPGTNGKTFKDIEPVRGGSQGDGYNFTTTDGTTKFVPVQAIRGAMDKMKSGEYQFIHDGYGNVYAGNKSNGATTRVAEGDPKLRRGQNTPAEVQTMEWLMSKGVAKDSTAAWEMVRSAREKTRSSFVMDYVAKNAGLGQDTGKLADQAGKIYDELRQGQAPGAGAVPSNSPAAGTLGSGTYDPRINSLIGVPSQ